jgi:hypothetical protein
MILTTLIAAIAASPAASVGDFFPLAPGTRWTYEDTTTHEEYVQEAGEPMEVGDGLATPVYVKERGRRGETAYYRIVDDTVFLVAYDAKKPLAAPMPVLKVGPDRVKWTYSGKLPFDGGEVTLVQAGESAPKGRRKVLEQQLDVIEVKFERTFETMKMRQESVYARGIGMVEMKEVNLTGKKQEKHGLKLTKFVPAVQGSD